MRIETKSFDFKQHLTLIELNYGFNWQLAGYIPHSTPDRSKERLSEHNVSWKELHFGLKFEWEILEIFFAISEKLLWWVGNGRGSLQSMLKRDEEEANGEGWREKDGMMRRNWKRGGERCWTARYKLSILWFDHTWINILHLITNQFITITTESPTLAIDELFWIVRFHSNIDLIAPFSGI